MKLSTLALAGAFAISTTASALTLSPTYTVYGSNGFGSTLMKEAINQDQSEGQLKNTMTSPLSAFMALSMVLNGTGGATHKALLDKMGLYFDGWDDIGVETANPANQYLMNTLSQPKTDEETPVFVINNGAWHTTAKDKPYYEFNQKYQDTLSTYYSAEVGSLDFSRADSADVINDWVKENTYGLIPKIINPGILQDMLWIALNTTYFEGQWAEPFYPLPATMAPEFKLMDGQVVEAEMIQRMGHYRYLQTEAAQIIEIPFKKGKGANEFTFIAILPEDGDFQYYQEQAWSQEYWQNLMLSMRDHSFSYGELVMPKFSFDYSVEIKPDSDITSALGLDFLFNDRADFFPMATEDSEASKVALIKQATRIELDENGVKAAAATLVGGVVATSIDVPVPSFKMVLDRPFLFAITEKKTDSLLFLGSVVDPTQN